MAPAVALMTPDEEPENDEQLRPENLEQLATLYRSMFENAAKVVRSRIELVSPAAAAAYLARNDHNRPLSVGLAHRYAEIMLSGQWAVNGQGVIRDLSGALLDGQHRLNGVVHAGVSVPMLIVEGVCPDVFRTIDQGRKRDFAGYLAINGDKHASTLGGAVRWLMWFESQKKTIDISARMACQPSITNLFALLDMHPGVRESVRLICGHKKRKLIIPAPLACLHYLAARRHPGEVTDRFWNQLLTGTDIVADSPVHKLRSILEKNAISASQYPIQTYLALVSKAFNYTIQGKKLTCLKWASDDEPFPHIV